MADVRDRSQGPPSSGWEGGGASTRALIDTLEADRHLDRNQWIAFFRGRTPEALEYLSTRAREVSRKQFGRDIYTRGLIEFTNYCRNDCYYCGIRRSNAKADRYRLTDQQIMDCCKQGYGLGFRTFVLQGGEDPQLTEDRIACLVTAIKDKYPDCAVTLSIGEWERSSYERFFRAGADRYLLRHETADPEHYRRLHPKGLSPEHRKQCLRELAEIGYQAGTGFMIGSPGQGPEQLAEDMLFIEQLAPQMIGIGPFVPHHDTPFAGERAGTVEETLYCIGALRLMLPQALIPATTALGTMAEDGRERGILAGANVVMPNLSPLGVREKYELYDNKICTGDEAAECRDCLELRMESIGYRLVVSRGDHPQAGKEERNV